jgi:hypothetical protein
MQFNRWFPLLRFSSALHCGYSGNTDIQDGLFFVSTRARTFKKARVRCTIDNSKIFAKTFNIFIRGRYLYQWYHYNHNAKRYENVMRGIIYSIQFVNICTTGLEIRFPSRSWWSAVMTFPAFSGWKPCFSTDHKQFLADHWSAVISSPVL